MEILNNLMHGFSVAFALDNLMWAAFGVFMGNLIGVLPGMGVLAAISILLPLTYTMTPTAALVMLSGTAWWRLTHADGRWLAGTVALHATLFACAALWLQWRAPRQRRSPLLWSWRAGLIVLLLAALALVVGPDGGMLAAVLGLGVALPLLLLSMALEIVAFIGWIELHRLCGRGVQLPGVQRLLPDSEKLGVLLAQLPLLLLPAAALWPSAWLVRAAGLALLFAWLGVWSALRGVRRRTNGFLLTLEDRQ